MQEISQIALLDEAVVDLKNGKQFYNQIQQGIGEYFYDSIIADIESLYLYAGIHPIRYGYHTLFSHRFPFAIYYQIEESTAIVVAVLDMRRNPAWARDQLQTRP